SFFSSGCRGRYDRSPSKRRGDDLSEQPELLVGVRADRRERDRVDADGGDPSERVEDLIRRAGRGELVEQVFGESRRDRVRTARRSELGELVVAAERGELGGDAVLEQDLGDPLSGVAAVGVDAALDEDDEAVQVAASRRAAAFVDAFAGPANI